MSLDQVAPENPVWVECWSGHGLIVNAAALHRLGLSEEEADTDELHYERFPGTNQLSGRFTEYAQWVQRRRLASLATKEEKLKSLHAMSDEAIHFGVTSMQVMPTTAVDEFASLLNEAQLPVRIRAMDFPLPGTPSWTAYSDRRGAGNISSMVRISGLKWILDGTPWSAVLRYALLMQTNRAGKASSTSAPPNLIAPYNAPGAATTKLYSTLLETARLPNCSGRWKEPDRTKDGDQSASEWNTAKVSCPTFCLWPLSAASSLFKIRRTSVCMM
jgi:hypothetical protein